METGAQKVKSAFKV